LLPQSRRLVRLRRVQQQSHNLRVALHRCLCPTTTSKFPQGLAQLSGAQRDVLREAGCRAT
jgi:hypothetical protein